MHSKNEVSRGQQHVGTRTVGVGRVLSWCCRWLVILLFFFSRCSLALRIDSFLFWYNKERFGMMNTVVRVQEERERQRLEEQSVAVTTPF